MRDKKLYLWAGLIALIATVAYAAGFERISKDTLKLGAGNAADKTIEMDVGAANNPFVKYDNAGSKFVFSNDGVNSKDIGSGAGGGGGLNDLAESNPDCEAGVAGVPNDWSSTGPALSQTAVSGELINGLQSCAWDSNGAAQTTDSATVTVSPRNIGKACLERIYYRYEAGSAANGDLTVTVFDGTNNLIDPQDVLVTTGPIAGLIQLAFTCPTSGNYRIRFTSVAADAEELIWDDAHLGENDTIGVDNQPTATGRILYTAPGTVTNAADTVSEASYIHTGKTLSVYLRSLQTGAAGGSISFQAVDYLPPGFTIDLTKIPAASQLLPCGVAHSVDDSAASSNNQKSGTVILDTSGAMQIIRADSGGDDRWNSTSPITWAAGDQMHFQCDGIPVNEGNVTKETVTLETQGWMIDANIGGGILSLGVIDVATYTAVNNAGLDLVINTVKGSANVGIGCSSTNPSDPGDLVCAAGDEEASIVFDAPYSGIFEVCSGFIHEMRVDTGVSIITTFQLVQTTNSTQTIIQEGDTRIGNTNQGDNGGGINDLDSHATNICGTFSLSAGKTTIRLMYEQKVSGVPDFSQLAGDRAADRGQRDFHFTVRPLTQNFPQAVAFKLAPTTGCPTGTNVCSEDGLTFTATCEASAVTTVVANSLKYLRVGNLAQVGFVIQYDPVAVPATEDCNFTIPELYTNVFPSSSDVSGVCKQSDPGGDPDTAMMFSNSGLNTIAIRFEPTTTNQRTYYCTGTMEVP